MWPLRSIRQGASLITPSQKTTRPNPNWPYIRHSIPPTPNSWMQDCVLAAKGFKCIKTTYWICKFKYIIGVDQSPGPHWGRSPAPHQTLCATFRGRLGNPCGSIFFASLKLSSWLYGPAYNKNVGAIYDVYKLGLTVCSTFIVDVGVLQFVRHLSLYSLQT